MSSQTTSTCVTTVSPQRGITAPTQPAASSAKLSDSTASELLKLCVFSFLRLVPVLKLCSRCHNYTNFSCKHPKINHNYQQNVKTGQFWCYDLHLLLKRSHANRHVSPGSSQSKAPEQHQHSPDAQSSLSVLLTARLTAATVSSR